MNNVTLPNENSQYHNFLLKYQDIIDSYIENPNVVFHLTTDKGVHSHALKYLKIMQFHNYILHKVNEMSSINTNKEMSHETIAERDAYIIMIKNVYSQ